VIIGAFEEVTEEVTAFDAFVDVTMAELATDAVVGGERIEEGGGNVFVVVVVVVVIEVG
jgi:hypothetical protein